MNVCRTDATALDTWVLDELRTLLRNASDTSNPHSAQLNHDLHQPKTIFFLHLLGLDTTGHSYRPFSKEYMHNIQVVDDIVNEVEVLMKEFYGEEETAYLFTADHGMSLIGNHGDGREFLSFYTYTYTLMTDPLQTQIILVHPLSLGVKGFVGLFQTHLLRRMTSIRLPGS
jgi:predicted AlkP superfamily pyrophosphatase or phosphodiesterase